MTSPAPMKNLGPVSRRWLSEVGIHSLADLQQHDPVDVWKRIKANRPEANLVLLYAMVGALMGVHWQQVSPDLKAQLEARANA